MNEIASPVPPSVIVRLRERTDVREILWIKISLNYNFNKYLQNTFPRDMLILHYTTGTWSLGGCLPGESLTPSACRVERSCGWSLARYQPWQTQSSGWHGDHGSDEQSGDQHTFSFSAALIVLHLNIRIRYPRLQLFKPQPSSLDYSWAWPSTDLSILLDHREMCPGQMSVWLM